MLEDKIGMGGKKHCNCHGSGSESDEEEVSGGASFFHMLPASKVNLGKVRAVGKAAPRKIVGDESSAGKLQAELNKMMNEKMAGLPFDMERYKELKSKLESSGGAVVKVGVSERMDDMERPSRNGSTYRPSRPGVKGKGSKTSSWIEHVKAYAAKHGVSYKDAMSAAKASYKK